MMKNKNPAFNFLIGSQVQAPGLRHVSTVIEGPNSKGEYLLGYGSLTLWVHKSKLSPTKEKKKKAGKGSSNSVLPSDEIIRIDLHGYKKQDALEALESAINNALLRRCPRIEVVHGLGTGVIKNAVSEYLSKCKYIERYKVDDANPGITLVWL
jgi:DNA mismatch repair protein MutS2